MDIKTLHDMFWLGVPVIEKILRPITIYAFLIVSLRLAGKRELRATQSVRPRRAADNFEHGAERDHR